MDPPCTPAFPGCHLLHAWLAVPSTTAPSPLAAPFFHWACFPQQDRHDLYMFWTRILFCKNCLPRPWSSCHCAENPLSSEAFGFNVTQWSQVGGLPLHGPCSLCFIWDPHAQQRRRDLLKGEVQPPAPPLPPTAFPNNPQDDVASYLGNTTKQQDVGICLAGVSLMWWGLSWGWGVTSWGRPQVLMSIRRVRGCKRWRNTVRVTCSDTPGAP